MRRGHIVDHIEGRDWQAMIAGAGAGLVCALAPSALALLLRWLA